MRKSDSAGRLEAQFKKLKEKVPGHYDNSMLKECLFHGSINNLKIPSGFAIRGKKPPMRNSFGRPWKLRKKRTQR